MIRKILVATDGSDHANRALAYASDIASKYDGVLYLVHVVSFPHSVALSGRPYGEPGMEIFMKHMRQAGKEIIKAAEAAARTSGVKRMKTFLVEGDPTSEILGIAKQNDVDAIVLGSRGAGVVGQLTLGSVSHKVCHLADRTCMTVK